MIITASSPANSYNNNYIQQNRITRKNNLKNIVFTGGGNTLTLTQRTKLIKQLSSKMQNRPEYAQKLYKYAIDFVNNKLTKDKFIQKMYKLLDEGFKELNDNEARYVCNYGIAFDRNGNNPKKFTYKSITDSFDSLLYDV